MLNDITLLNEAQFGEIGTQYWLVKANTSTQGTGTSYIPAFRPGEPVSKTLGTGTTNNSAQTLGTIGTGTSAKPVVATDFLAGIAVSGQGGKCSTETATANGYVYVLPLVPNVTYLGNADVPATYGYNTTTGVFTQATYDALVGSRVLIKMSAGVPPVFTILASDGSTSGLIVQPLDIAKYPGKVAFQLRQGLNYTT